MNAPDFDFKKILYPMIGEPFQKGAVQLTTTPFANTDVDGTEGVAGATAQRIVTVAEAVKL